jgi:hypothetical protein
MLRPKSRRPRSTPSQSNMTAQRAKEPRSLCTRLVCNTLPHFLRVLGHYLVEADGTNQDTDLTPEAFEEHFKTEHFAALGKTISEEGLLAAPLDICRWCMIGARKTLYIELTPTLCRVRHSLGLSILSPILQTKFMPSDKTGLFYIDKDGEQWIRMVQHIIKPPPVYGRWRFSAWTHSACGVFHTDGVGYSLPTPLRS